MSLAFGTRTTTLDYAFGASPPNGIAALSMIGWFYAASAPPGGNPFWSWMQVGIPAVPNATGPTGQSDTQVSCYGALTGTAATAYVSGGTNINDAFGAVTYPSWHHIAVTITGTTIRGYLNGTLNLTDTITGGTPPSGNWAGLRLGYFLDPARAPDAVQDVSFWSKGLTQAEVQRCMRYRSAPQGQTGLVAWYPFTGASLADASGNDRDLTVTTGSVSDSPLAPPTFTLASRSAGRAGVGRRHVRSR